MARLARCLAASLSAVILAVVCLPSRGEAMGGLPQPPPDVNFTVAVEGTVWCKSCRYAGYVQSSMDASPLPGNKSHCSAIHGCLCTVRTLSH